MCHYLLDILSVLKKVSRITELAFHCWKQNIITQSQIRGIRCYSGGYQGDAVLLLIRIIFLTKYSYSVVWCSAFIMAKHEYWPGTNNSISKIHKNIRVVKLNEFLSSMPNPNLVTKKKYRPLTSSLILSFLHYFRVKIFVRHF